MLSQRHQCAHLRQPELGGAPITRLAAARPTALARPSDAPPRQPSAVRPLMATASPASPADAPPAVASVGTTTRIAPETRRSMFEPASAQDELVEARVVGTLPSWLRGTHHTNGGGDWTGMAHMFDGYALVSSLRFDGGRAWARQSFLPTRAHTAFARTGRPAFREFATPLPSEGLLATALRVATEVMGFALGRPSLTDNASVNVVPVTGRGGEGAALLALSETRDAAYLVDPAAPGAAQPVRYADGVPGDITTAHPTVLSDGSLLNFTRTLPFGGFHLYRQDPATLSRTQVAFVPDRRPLSPAWLHDFAANDDWAVLVEHPLYMSLPSLLLGTPAQHYFLDWVPQDGTRVTVVRLDGSQPPRVFSAPPFFTFHYANLHEAAAEAGGSGAGRVLHMDMASYEDPTILKDLSLDSIRNAPKQVSRARLTRMTIPLDAAPGAGGALPAPAPLLHYPTAAMGDFAEFPAVHPRYRGKPYRYIYALSAVRPTHLGNALSKVDLQTGEALTWHEPGTSPGEPCFVPAPNGTTEDAGVVIAPVAGPGAASWSVVLDAATWTELARVEMPFRVPNRFHGAWLAE